MQTAAELAQIAQAVAPAVQAVTNIVAPSVAPQVAEAVQTVESGATIVEDINSVKNKILAGFSNSLNSAREHIAAAAPLTNTPKQQTSISIAFQKLDDAFLRFHAALVNL
jgi:hypothetical protein